MSSRNRKAQAAAPAVGLDSAATNNNSSSSSKQRRRRRPRHAPHAPPRLQRATARRARSISGGGLRARGASRVHSCAARNRSHGGATQSAGAMAPHRATGSSCGSARDANHSVALRAPELVSNHAGVICAVRGSDEFDPHQQGVWHTRAPVRSMREAAEGSDLLILALASRRLITRETPPAPRPPAAARLVSTTPAAHTAGGSHACAATQPSANMPLGTVNTGEYVPLKAAAMLCASSRCCR